MSIEQLCSLTITALDKLTRPFLLTEQLNKDSPIVHLKFARYESSGWASMLEKTMMEQVQSGLEKRYPKLFQNPTTFLLRVKSDKGIDVTKNYHNYNYSYLLHGILLKGLHRDIVQKLWADVDVAKGFSYYVQHLKPRQSGKKFSSLLDLHFSNWFEISLEEITPEMTAKLEYERYKNSQAFLLAQVEPKMTRVNDKLQFAFCGLIKPGHQQNNIIFLSFYRFWAEKIWELMLVHERSLAPDQQGMIEGVSANMEEDNPPTAMSGLIHPPFASPVAVSFKDVIKLETDEGDGIVGESNVPDAMEEASKGQASKLLFESITDQVENTTVEAQNILEEKENELLKYFPRRRRAFLLIVVRRSDVDEEGDITKPEELIPLYIHITIEFDVFDTGYDFSDIADEHFKRDIGDGWNVRIIRPETTDDQEKMKEAVHSKLLEQIKINRRAKLRFKQRRSMEYIPKAGTYMLVRSRYYYAQEPQEPLLVLENLETDKIAESGDFLSVLHYFSPRLREKMLYAIKGLGSVSPKFRNRLLKENIHVVDQNDKENDIVYVSYRNFVDPEDMLEKSEIPASAETEEDAAAKAKKKRRQEKKKKNKKNKQEKDNSDKEGEEIGGAEEPQAAKKESEAPIEAPIEPGETKQAVAAEKPQADIKTSQAPIEADMQHVSHKVDIVEEP
eukprot:Platyproteum_vivax@DN7561_c1_g1_i1.p1